jgi:hypothetical protein
MRIAYSAYLSMCRYTDYLISGVQDVFRSISWKGRKIV